MGRNGQEPPNSAQKQSHPLAFINGADARIKNPFKIVVTEKKDPDDQVLRGQLIELTERLARDAKDGTLKGMGGFADYGESFILGLEGSYLKYPDTAVFPLQRLQWRVMNEVEKKD